MKTKEEQEKGLLTYLLLKFYGNLLKVSRANGVTKNLPMLRAYLQENPDVVDAYGESLQEEIDGMGLENDLQLGFVKVAQLKALKEGDSKNSTIHSDEIEKTIKKGKTDREIGDKVVLEEAEANMGKVNSFINNPLQFQIDTLSTADCEAIKEKLLESFEVFSKWAFQIQMGFKFQEQDFHKLIFETCQRVVDGELDRLIVNIPPRHSKTQILSIFLPLYSFCHNPGSHNIITSYAEDVCNESSGYIRTIMTDDRFAKVFSDVRIDPSKRSIERWGTTAQGVMNAVSTGGKMTGKGAGSLSPVYSGCFVVDD